MADEFQGGTSAGGVTVDVTGLELAEVCQQSYISVMGCNMQPGKCTLDCCTMCHSISIRYQDKVLSTWRTQDQAHRMSRLGLGCLHGHLSLNVWLCFQPQLRPGFLELQKAAKH